MKRVQVVPSWSFRDSEGRQLSPELFSLLRAIHAEGKLTAAVEQVGISYRHGWNLLNRWADFFGLPLVAMAKGRGATLTALGEKLLWAEQRVVARLEPQLESLASELNIEIHRALAGVSPLLRLHASHGYAVALLPEHTAEIQLDLQYKSAEDALRSLNRGDCDLAGFHLPVAGVNSALVESYSRYLNPEQHVVIRFIRRCQGLMLKAGNPLRVEGIEDLTRDGLRFINRQKDSGTRVLLDELLSQAGVDPQQIQGYTDEEFTHSAVAAYVASGMADVGMGVEAAAKQFGLEFIPLSYEYYLLVCRREALEQEGLIRFLEGIRSSGFCDAVNQLPGYQADRCGELVAVDELLADL